MNLQELTPKAKLTALGHGHSLIGSLSEVMDMIQELTPVMNPKYESFTVEPIGPQYVLTVTPKARLRDVE